MSCPDQKQRPFLKWAGGKYEIVDKIRKFLPEGKVLTEPFVGAGAVFLNAEYDRYLLNDVNKDLINLYTVIQKDGVSFIEDAKSLFVTKNNSNDAYYALRNRFNTSDDTYERSIIFLYLNKFGYNGLCRYNQSGEFNVPFGRHRNPSFPQDQLEFFIERSKRAKFVCEDFRKTFSRARKSHVIYCDPPYVPLSDTANFSAYAKGGFTLGDQVRLAHAAVGAAQRGIAVVLSNHDTDYTRRLYRGAKIIRINVSRKISRDSKTRSDAKELIAVFRGKNE